jgi:hypothetical protein
MILLISASSIARITGVSHWHLARFFLTLICYLPSENNEVSIPQDPTHKRKKTPYSRRGHAASHIPRRALTAWRPRKHWTRDLLSEIFTRAFLK